MPGRVDKVAQFGTLTGQPRVRLCRSSSRPINMSTATAPGSDFPGLLRHEALRVEQHRLRLHAASMLRRVSLRLTREWAAWLLRRHASELASSALCLEGLAHRLDKQPVPRHVDADGVMVNQLIALEAKMAGLRAMAQRWAPSDSGAGASRLRDAATALAESAEGLGQQVRELRGAVMAHDANVDALRRAGRSIARTPAELDEALA